MRHMETSNDHDLLITIKEKISNIGDEMRLLRDGTNERLKSVEQNMVNKADFIEYKILAEKNLNEVRSDLEKRLVKAEDNITTINRNMYIIIGMGIIAQIAIPLLIKVIFKF